MISEDDKQKAHEAAVEGPQVGEPVSERVGVVPAMDSSNRSWVGVRGDGAICVSYAKPIMSRAEAINLAAWLAVLADPVGEDFARMVREIKQS